MKRPSKKYTEDFLRRPCPIFGEVKKMSSIDTDMYYAKFSLHTNDTTSCEELMHVIWRWEAENLNVLVMNSSYRLRRELVSALRVNSSSPWIPQILRYSPPFAATSYSRTACTTNPYRELVSRLNFTCFASTETACFPQPINSTGPKSSSFSAVAQVPIYWK